MRALISEGLAALAQAIMWLAIAMQERRDRQGLADLRVTVARLEERVAALEKK